jgi:acyl-CoA thioesterase I
VGRRLRPGAAIRLKPIVVGTSLIISLLRAAPALAQLLSRQRCWVPDALLGDSAPLPSTAKALRSHRPLIIVALGSSSTKGVGASRPSSAYPAVLERELAARTGISVTVINRGIAGEVAVQTASRISSDVFPLYPTLVIWQTGTNDLIRSGPPVAFERTLVDGIERMRRRSIDVILMDPQYFPRGEHRPSLAAYLDVMGRVAERYHVPVLHRHRIMSYWVASGEMPVNAILSRDGLHMSDASYRCLGELLADFIIKVALATP